MNADLELCLNEGFELTEDSKVFANGRKYPISHPARIYLSIYRESKIPLIRLHAFQAVHDFLWPHLIATNNDWQERMFAAHVDHHPSTPGKDNKIIVLASGGGIGKSDVCARIAIIFWLANPSERAVVISSTTLESLEKRIWGYVISRINEMVLPFPFDIKKSKPPKIILPGQEHELTGIFTAAIREGEDERTLSTAVGKHPPDGLLVFLDESPFISASIIDAIPNWERGTPWFQLWGLGNSDSTHDLHGALATPIDGWGSINQNTYKWVTCQERGVCLYFNPHDSPAIKETDPIKKAALSKFLITQEQLDSAKKKYGEHSDNYYRQVLGFWKQSSMDDVVITEKSIDESNVKGKSEFSGLYPISVVAGLDPAIDDKAKGCVLRFGLLGHTTSGLWVLDYRSEMLLHYIETSATMTSSQERQLADNIIDKLLQYKCPLSSLAMDATGIGRLLGELIKARMKDRGIQGWDEEPIKIISRNGTAGKGKDKDFNFFTRTALELWETLVLFMQTAHIKGLDPLTTEQLSNRQITKSERGAKELESKEKFKKRMAAKNPILAQSPNEADGAVLVLQAAMIKHGFHIGQITKINKETRFHDEKYRRFLVERGQAQAALNDHNRELERKAIQIPCATFKGSAEAIVWAKNK